MGTNFHRRCSMSSYGIGLPAHLPRGLFGWKKVLYVSIEATVYETAYHWYHGLLTDAGFETLPVIGERKLYSVACDAALLDLRPLAASYPGLLHKTDYTYARSVGARIHREGHPGIVVPSARLATGENFAVFNPAVLSNPRSNCQLTYRVDGARIVIEKKPGMKWLQIPIAELAVQRSPGQSAT